MDRDRRKDFFTEEDWNDDTVQDVRKEEDDNLLKMFEKEVKRQHYDTGKGYRACYKLSMMRDEILRRMVL